MQIDDLTRDTGELVDELHRQEEGLAEIEKMESRTRMNISDLIDGQAAYFNWKPKAKRSPYKPIQLVDLISKHDMYEDVECNRLTEFNKYILDNVKD